MWQAWVYDPQSESTARIKIQRKLQLYSIGLYAQSSKQSYMLNMETLQWWTCNSCFFNEQIYCTVVPEIISRLQYKTVQQMIQ